MKAITAEKEALSGHVQSLQGQLAKLKEEPAPRKSIMVVSEEMRNAREELKALRVQVAEKSQEVLQLQAQLIETKQKWGDYANDLRATLQEVENDAVKVKIANAEMRTKLEALETQLRNDRPKKRSIFFRG